MRRAAKVSLGLPVYNGARYVAAAIESVLSQTLGEFELVISDNASTDATGSICRQFAARDPRVRYTRLDDNIGAILNFARVYDLCAGGECFKWVAHDDVIKPRFLESCVCALDENAGAVLAYSRACFIDPQGSYLRDYPVKLATDSSNPSERFAAIACAHHKSTSNLEIFGLLRRSAVEQIPQQGGYAGSDRVFLARLALLGPFIEVPEMLFCSRDHPGQSIKTLPEHLRQKRSTISRLVGHGQLPPAEWFDSRFKGRVTFPEWRIAWEYLTSVRYGQLAPSQRIRVVTGVLRRQLSHHNWARMARDFIIAGDFLAAQIFEKAGADPDSRHRPAARIAGTSP